MICACCGSRDLTTGGCIHCMATTWCICGARFCANHGQEHFAKHLEACPSVQRVGEIQTVGEVVRPQTLVSCAQEAR